jgi:hypothetical protein
MLLLLLVTLVGTHANLLKINGLRIKTSEKINLTCRTN